MRLLYFQQNFAFGSAETYLADLTNKISAYGYDVHLAYPAVPALSTGFGCLAKRDVTVHACPDNWYTDNIQRTLSYWIRFFRKIKPDIVHFNDPCIVGGIAAWLSGVPVRVMMHHTPELHRRFNVIGRTLEKLAFRTFSCCIMSNQSSRQTAIERDNIPEAKTAVIPFGLQPEWFAPINPDERAQTRAALGFSEEAVLILCPARLSVQKRHDILIQAAKDVLSQSDQDLHFLLAGDGELFEDVEHTVNTEQLTNRVHLLGFRPDVRKLMDASDILALSSDFEGFPYAILEASARQLPAVTTDVGGIRHSVIHNETGLLVQPGASSKLADALLHLVRNPVVRTTFGQAARRYAEENFALDRMIANTAELYGTLVNQLSGKSEGGPSGHKNGA